MKLEAMDLPLHRIAYIVVTELNPKTPQFLFSFLSLYIIDHIHSKQFCVPLSYFMHFSKTSFLKNCTQWRAIIYITARNGVQ